MNLQAPARQALSQGIALIVTLIMLAVITFMAVTFLVLSSRERGSVATSTEQTTAAFAADSALERAKIEALSRIIGFGNDQNYDLMVSTNFYSQGGFQAGISSFTNVGYNYPGGNRLNAGDLLINLVNLYYDPRPPVFVVTNPAAFPNNVDFRYFLDLNRNGRDDANGLWPVISTDTGRPYYNTNGQTMPSPLAGVTLSNLFVGDPEWIGILEHPESPHSANNRFLARYAYVIVPAGKTLDVNYIHNDAKREDPNLNDGFMRNQGVGTWELNLAAFLADLNTNQWQTLAAPYTYATAGGIPNAAIPNNGFAFEDARSLLNYRYNFNLNNLQNANQLFGPNFTPAASFQIDNVDEYADGPFQTGTTLNGDNDNITLRWPGADNPNHFFTTQEYFDRNKIKSTAPLTFVDRLQAAGSDFSTYDQYTFYRMLAQLGSDSVADQGKINLNHANVDAYGNVVVGMETNLLRWEPLQFFTNAAARMFAQLGLRDNLGNPITVTNIPLYPNSYYTPAVHRVLQLAANMFEATTNVLYPSVYRPFFHTVNLTNIVIAGYELVSGPDTTPTQQSFFTPSGTPISTDPRYPIDLNDPTARVRIQATPTFLNVFGAPWVIGARKGFPNFNVVAMQSVAEITRKLRVSRPSLGAPQDQFHVSQLIEIGISNSVAVEVWNSYRTNYPRPIYIQADGILLMSLTNGIANSASYPAIIPIAPISTALAIGGSNLATNRGAINFTTPNLWQGTGWIPGQNSKPVNAKSFLVPLLTNIVFIPECAYRQNPAALIPIPTNAPQDWLINPADSFPLPQWGLTVSNRIRCFMLDGGPSGRVIDYVEFGGLNSVRDLTSEIYTRNQSSGVNNMWSTNSVFSLLGTTPMPQGLNNQIEVSVGNVATSDTDWQNNMAGAPTGNARNSQIANFNAFVYGGNSGGVATYVDPTSGRSYTATNRNLTAQVPFTPTSRRYLPIFWEANDPLVHYTAEDLNNQALSNNISIATPPNAKIPTIESNLWTYTGRYDPWGGNPKKGSSGDQFAFDLSVKDPQLRASDDWDFPTNELPNVGWMGRIHRGTPWQTVYLKSADISALKNWTRWTGDGGTNAVTWSVGGSNVADAYLSRPAQDRLLFDSFTTAPNANASRGQLSVNQTNLAAWSAALSGVIVVTNFSGPGTTNVSMGWTMIDPAGVYDPRLSPQTNKLVEIWQGINTARGNTNPATGPVFANQVFNHLGDILSVPQLTEKSPYLTTNNLYSANGSAGGVDDKIMERLPQQIMSLLTLNHSPRFVIYSYGQSLKPAEHSIQTFGTAVGLCTNYQVTAEVATRAVVRVEGSPDPSAVSGKADAFGRTYPPRIVVEQYNVLPAE